MLLNTEGMAVGAMTRTSPEARRFLAVGEHVIDVDTLRLLTGADGMRLTPKAMGVLLQLVGSAGRTLSRDDLLNEVWKGTCPTPDVLTQAVKDLRRTLGDDPHAPRYVETLPRLGYRLIATARFVDAAPLAGGARRVPIVRGHSAHGARALTGVFAALALVLVGTALLYLRQSYSSSAAPRWHVAELRTITADPGPENYPRISPDGTRVAYSVGDAAMRNARIVQRSLRPSRVVRLSEASSGQEFHPAWSPDGALIAFARYQDERCSLHVIPALGGGPERRVGDCRNGAMNDFSWAPDARHLLTSAPSDATATDLALHLVPVDGGAAVPLAYAHAHTDIDLGGRYSPDGRLIAFRRGMNPYSDLYVVDAAGGHVRQLTHLASRLRGFDWTRDGSALVFSSSHAGPPALYTVSIADGRVEALGVQPAEFPSSARQADTLVYEIPHLHTQLASIVLGEDTAEHRDLAPSTGNDGAPAVSPVDDRLIFVSDRGGAQQLWLHDPASATIYALGDAAEPTLRYPAWRADGARVLVTARDAAAGRLVEIDIASGARQVLSAPDEDVRHGLYGARADTWLAVVAGHDDGPALIEIASVEGRPSSRRVLARGVDRIDYDPMGGAVYFTRTGQAGLFRLDPHTGAAERVTPRITPTLLAGWHVRDGHLFYLTPLASGASEVHRLALASGEDRRVAMVSDGLAEYDFDVTRDGRQAIIVRAATRDTDVGAVSLRRKGQD